jgi:hypothetical protein
MSGWGLNHGDWVRRLHHSRTHSGPVGIIIIIIIIKAEAKAAPSPLSVKEQV